MDLTAGSVAHPRHGVLLKPEACFLLNPEDRLWVPDTFVPLFKSRGWKEQTVEDAIAEDAKARAEGRLAVG